LPRETAKESDILLFGLDRLSLKGPQEIRDKGFVGLSHALRANMDETGHLVVITEQGENRNPTAVRLEIE